MIGDQGGMWEVPGYNGITLGWMSFSQERPDELMCFLVRSSQQSLMRDLTHATDKMRG